MKTITASIIAATLLIGPAFAHSPLKTTSPADGEKVTEAPDIIAITFGKKARLTKVTVVGPDETSTRLDLPTKSFTTTFDLTGAPDQPGIYSVRWRALGTDGHVLKGRFAYTVLPR